MNKQNNAPRINNFNKFLKMVDEKMIKKNKEIIIDGETFNQYLDRIYKEYCEISDIPYTPHNQVDIEPVNKSKPILKRPGTPPLTLPVNFVQITDQINSISDLITLATNYPPKLDTKYNINMKAIYDIKEYLIQLNNMIGLQSIKTNIVEQILYFAQELHKNGKSSGDFMHTVIYGPPGTGKTEIAKIMGNIYSKLGVLSKGTFKKVTRSDLIAGYLGQTALKTKDVIKECLGGVLFIDEAYSLGSSEKKDSFSKECIDTLCEALSDNKENLMVIIAGYENELKECFFSQNQGLDSRFIWRFKTDEYSGEDLHKIFLKKVTEIGWEIHSESKIDSEWFNKNKELFKFYGRDVENLLSKTKICHSKRVFTLPQTEKKKLTLKDLENGMEVYLKNNDIQSKKEEELKKQQLYHSLYC